MANRSSYLFFKIPQAIIRFICLSLCFIFVFEQSGLCQVVDMAPYVANRFLGSWGQESQSVDTLHLPRFRYMFYDETANSFKIFLDKGDLKNMRLSEIDQNLKKLFNFFLIGISLPNDSFWVNLKPDESQNIIDFFVAQTEIGKIFLEADLQLKKDTALATSPDTEEGRAYWKELNQKAKELFGDKSKGMIPEIHVGARTWIVPDEIVMRGGPRDVYVYKATLKVQTEEEYFNKKTLIKAFDPRTQILNEYSAQLLRKLIIPKLTREVNLSKKYVALRQVYHSLIFAHWFKLRFRGRGSLYSWLIDRSSIGDQKQFWSVDDYFKKYKKSIEFGEYRFYETCDSFYGQSTKVYISGGIVFGAQAMQEAFQKGSIFAAAGQTKKYERCINANNFSYLINFSIKGGKISDPSDILITKMELPLSSQSAQDVVSSPLSTAYSNEKKTIFDSSLKIRRFFTGLLTTAFLLLNTLTALAHDFVQKGDQLLVNVAPWSRISPSENTLWGIAKDLLNAELGRAPSNAQIMTQITELAKINHISNSDLIQVTQYNAQVNGLSQEAVGHLVQAGASAKSQATSVVHDVAQKAADAVTHIPLPKSIDSNAVFWQDPHVWTIALVSLGIIGVAFLAYHKWFHRSKIRQKKENIKENTGKSQKIISKNIHCCTAEKLIEETRTLIEAPLVLNEMTCLAVINNIKQIRYLTPFTVERVWLNIKTLNSIYKNLYDIIMATTEKIRLRLDSETSMNITEKKKLLSYLKELSALAIVTVNYIDALVYLRNLEQMTSYFLGVNKQGTGESYGLLAEISRRLYGIRREISKSRKEFTQHFLKIGADKEMRQQWEKFLDVQLSYKSDELIGIEGPWLARKVLLGRLAVPISVGFLKGVLANFAVWNSGVLANAGFLGCATTFFVNFAAGFGLGFALSLGISWITLWAGHLKDTCKAKKPEIDRLNDRIEKFAQQINKAYGVSSLRIAEKEDILYAELEDTFSAFIKEKSSHFEPSADLLLVITPKKMIEEKKSSLSGLLERVMNKNTPMAFVSLEKNGSAYSLVESFHFFFSKDFDHLKKNHPHLNKKLKNLRVVVVMAHNQNEMFMELPFEVLGKKLTAFEYAVMNGYKGTRGLLEQGQGGMIFVNPEGIYIGPMGHGNFMSFWSNGEQIEKQNLGMFIVGTDNKIRRFYEKFDFGDIRKKLERQDSAERWLFPAYDFDDMTKKQFRANTGTMRFVFDKEDAGEEGVPAFFRLMESVRAYLTKEAKNEVVYAAADILAPLIMKSSGDDMYKYWAIRFGNISQESRNFYLKLFDIYRDFPVRFDFTISDTLAEGCLYSRMDGSDFEKKIILTLIEFQQRGDISGILKTIDQGIVTKKEDFSVEKRPLEEKNLPHQLARPLLSNSSPLVRFQEQKITSASNYGGIDFTALPMSTGSSLKIFSDTYLKWDTDHIDELEAHIKSMLSNGLIPPARALKYFFKICIKNQRLKEKSDVLHSWIADIFRKEEECFLASENDLKDLLRELEFYA